MPRTKVIYDTSKVLMTDSGLLERLAALMRYISSRICPFRDVLAYDALAEYRERERLREERDRKYAKELLQQAGYLMQAVEVNGKIYTWDMVNGSAH